MINITIKTLDSRNHEFSVEDDLTVKQLKEMIAESVSVPPESQRLIYCGRVLLDDKKLSEYDVNGKVIHLVQRAPPSSSTGVSSSSGGSSSSGRSSERSGSRARLDNAMYLGAMAFPADLIEAQGLTVPPARHTLSHSRLSVARSMLHRANNVLQSLEGRSDPPTEPAPSSDSSTPPESSTPPDPSLENNIQAEVTVPSEPSPATGSAEHRLRPSDLAAAASAAADAVTAALNHALSVHRGGNVSITVNNSDDNGLDDVVVRVTQGSNEPSAPPSGGTGTSRPRPAAQRTTALADLVTQLREVQSRMEPYLDRYYNLMQNDPPDATESQQVFNQVSELMHLLAHAYHALSDIMCDLTQAPPRVLRCRPVLIQHSAVLQTGLPIQVPTAQIINFSSPTNNSSQMESGSQTEGQNNSSQAHNRTEENNTSESQPRPESTPQNMRARVEEIMLNGLRPERPSGAERSGPTATVSISPSNLEIFMDVSSSHITLDSLEAAVLASSPPNSSNNPPPPPEQPNQGSSDSEQPPWRQLPSNDFIHNLFQRIYGEMSNIHNNNYNNNNNNSRNNSTDGGNTASSNSSRTHPSATTASASGGSSNTPSSDRENPDASVPQRDSSTGPSGGSTPQPRTTFSSRPHIHIGPGPHIQAVDFFDPFLPCNSHHIRGRRRGAGTSNSNASDSNQHNSADSGVPSSDSSVSGPSVTPHPTVQMTLLPPGPTRRNIVQHILPIFPREVMRNLQSISIRSGGIMRTTVAQLLEALPGLSYTPGQSLILDFFMTAGRSIMLQDVIGDASPAMLGWMRPGLRDYLENTLGVDSTCSDTAIQSAIDRINGELTPFFETPFEGLTMREDIDLPASIRKVTQAHFPQLFRDIHQADNFTYSVNVSQHVLKFIHGIVGVLAFASNTPRASLETVIFAFTCKLVSGNSEEVRTWLVGEVALRLRQVVRPFDFVRDTFRSFIVYVPPPQGNNSQPMEVDGVEEASSPEVLPSPQRDREPLPHVIIGSEPWHHDVPPDWVPIITRDRERQRRGANQGPLSDAYLTGMPSKRRKLLTDAKPNTSLNKVISESMGRALGAAGLAPSAAAELIEAASCDSGLRNAYKAQVRSTLESTLRSHPDYHPEKYPNTAKYFNRLHR